MSNNIPTLLDVIQDRECKVLTSAVPQKASEIFTGYTETIDGFDYKALIETQAGSFEFRNLNGRAQTTLPEYDVRRFECAIGNPILRMDIAAYEMASKNGTIPDLMTRMKLGILTGIYNKLGRQFYYGSSEDAKGFEGLCSLVDDDLVFTAGGTTANKQSSVWFVAWGVLDTSILYGGGKGKNFTWSELQDETLTDSSGNSAVYKTCYLTMYPCVSVANKISIARVANVESIDDDTLFKALSHCEEAGFSPSAIYMRPSILETLRASRTATNATGAPSPTPSDLAGIPIYPTLSISKTEAVISNLISLS